MIQKVALGMKIAIKESHKNGWNISKVQANQSRRKKKQLEEDWKNQVSPEV